MRIMLALTLAFAGTAGAAYATPLDDGYCDHAEGVAAATSAIQLAPSFEAQFGYIEQSPTSATPDAASTNLRLIAGMRYRLTGIYEGLATRDHGAADCRRHRALERVRGETMARALVAKVHVIDEALGEAEAILSQTVADAEARRTTAQEATATRLRVDELHELAAEYHRELSALPAPTSEPLGAALSAYHRADAEMEDAEASLRRAQGLDISVRAGVDDFLSGPNALQYFAVVSVGVNLGLLRPATTRSVSMRRSSASRRRSPWRPSEQNRSARWSRISIASSRHSASSLARIPSATARPCGSTLSRPGRRPPTSLRTSPAFTRSSPGEVGLVARRCAGLQLVPWRARAALAVRGGHGDRT